ncbi:MAG TPA: hypothetical protein VG347_09330, partial [Verrucomicrobiae bacterium]|nr:hypothetical protein [Verrucomicrobiae bacterium]
FVFGVYNDGLYEAGMDAQANGTWVNLNNAVPDGAETCLLLCFSLAILALLRHGAKRLPAFARR